MDLNILWFLLIAVLYTGFFVLEGFDFGVGILLKFIGKTDTERRVMINTIGPHWDGNEVWLLTAGGATFAAFPQWYATLFSGFYLPLFLLLMALIVRGVAFEFRSKDENPRWRATWDWMIFIGSLVPPLLLGVAFANLVEGVPIDANMHYTGGFFNLLNPFALLAGVTAVLAFTFHGALFLGMKTTGDLVTRALTAARRVWPVLLVSTIALLVYSYFATDIYEHLGFNPGAVPIGAVVAVLLAGYLAYRQRPGWSFIMSCLGITLVMATFFLMLFPRVMVSSTDPAYSLTIYNSASSPYTLTVMSIIALTLTPIVVGYQAWSYWVFRKRIESKPEKLTY